MMLRFLLVVVLASLACSNAFALSKVSVGVAKPTSLSRSTRFLRVASTTEAEDESDEASEERANLSSLKEKLTKFTSKLTGTKSMSSELKTLAKSDDPINGAKKLLKMDTLDDALLKSSSNFKLYDDFVTALVPRWSEKDLSPAAVKKLLGMDKIDDYALASSPNFKYYEKFVDTQIPIWIKKDTAPLDVFNKLGLDTVPWINLYLRESPGYKFYDKFMTSKLDDWAMNLLSKKDVERQLGIKQLTKKDLTGHPNFTWLKKFEDSADKIRVAKWEKQKFSSYDVWASLRVGAIRPGERRASKEYKAYRVYAIKLDDAIKAARKSKAPAPTVFGKKATPAEISARIQIWTDTRRSENFVKYAFGLSNLSGKELTSHKNYKYLDEFLKDRKTQKKVRGMIL